MHRHVHTCSHMHTGSHTVSPTCVHICTHHIPVHLYTHHTLTRTHMFTAHHTYSHTHHTPMHTHTRTHVFTCTPHAHLHTHAHTHFQHTPTLPSLPTFPSLPSYLLMSVSRTFSLYASECSPLKQALEGTLDYTVQMCKLFGAWSSTLPCNPFLPVPTTPGPSQQSQLCLRPGSFVCVLHTCINGM